MNFKFTSKTIAILMKLEKYLHLSKTVILEQALQDYAKKKILIQSELLQFAGVLDPDQANKMLKATRFRRADNKNKAIKL